MAKGKKDKNIDIAGENDREMLNDDFSVELIKDLNKEFGERVAYNLAVDEAPTIVKRWISTGSRLLDYIVANRRNGGFPEGRIIEISGPPSCGKSHIAFQTARTVQRMGGLVVYIDTENATPVEKLGDMGIDVNKRFIYADTHCTEEVFKIIESTVTKAASLSSKNIPILVVWDSVAATSPKAELEGEYDKDTMGLQARVLSKGMRKITGVIGHNNVTLICLNQIRSKIGVMFGDPNVTPGGSAIPFHSSVRISLNGGSAVKDKEGNVIGISVSATTKKNKVAPAHRRVEFEIKFGVGIDESESLFDMLREYCDKNGPIVDEKGVNYSIEGTGAWKLFKVVKIEESGQQMIVEKKFTKSDFGRLLDSEEFGGYLDYMIETMMTLKHEKKDET